MKGNDRPAPTGPSSAYRLLVVEDDRIIREALRAGLELCGYEVATAKDGRRALEVIGQMVPELIVLDLMVPVMSGERFVEILRLRGLRPRICVVVMSAEPDGDERARRMGADFFLRKPFSLIVLMREIERLLRRDPSAR